MGNIAHTNRDITRLRISVACPSKMNSVTYFIPYPRDNSTKTYSILLIPFGFVAYFSDGRKSKNSVNFLVVSCAVVYIRECKRQRTILPENWHYFFYLTTSSNIAHHCNDEYQVVLLHQYMYDGVKQGYWMRLCFKELRIFVVKDPITQTHQNRVTGIREGNSPVTGE